MPSRARPRYWPRAIIFLLFALISAHAETRSIQNGVTIIENLAQPSEPLRTIACSELWRVGGEEDVAGEPLGFITDIDVDAEGNTYLLDNSLSRVQVFDAAGQWLRTIGREGSGPGEFIRAESFLVLPNGDIGALQPLSAHVIGLTCEGLPAPNIAFRGNEGFQFVGLIDAASDRIIAGLTERLRQENESYVVETLATYDRLGNLKSTILQRMIRQRDQGAPADADGNSSFGEHWRASSDGTVYVSRRPHEYRIEIFDLEGTLQKIIQRQYRPVKLSDEELVEEDERVERLHRMTRGSGIDFQVDPYKRDISALYPRPGGELWVSTSRGALEHEAGTIGVFDVFDATGRYVRQTRLQVDYHPNRDSFELIGNRLYVIKEGQMRPSFVSESASATIYYDNENLDADDGDDEAPPLEVICYEL